MYFTNAPMTVISVKYKTSYYVLCMYIKMSTYSCCEYFYPVLTVDAIYSS